MTRSLGRWKMRNPTRWPPVVWALCILLFTAQVVVAEEEEPEPTAADLEEISRLRLETPEKATGPIECGNDYLQGKFDDVVSYYHERKDGYAYWRLKSEAEACMQASTLACTSPHVVMLKWQGENSTNWHSIVTRWVNAAALAEVLGLTVKIIFYNNGGGYPLCKVDRFIVFR